MLLLGILFFVRILLCAFPLRLSPNNGIVSSGHTNFYGGGVDMGGDAMGGGGKRRVCEMERISKGMGGDVHSFYHVRASATTNIAIVLPAWSTI